MSELPPHKSVTNVLVIAAHPDDEILGCGGTMALYARQKVQVTVVVVASGRDGDESRSIPAQSAHTRAALAKVGVCDLRMLGMPDQRLETVPLVNLISPLERIVREVRPQVVFTHHAGDANRDHKAVFEATLIATRPTEPFVKEVYTFDTASSTEWGYPRTFTPDTWVDISSTLDAKLEAMACYASELRDYPHPRSTKALRVRAQAFGNQCCMEAAEVFTSVRRVFRHGQAPL